MKNKLNGDFWVISFFIIALLFFHLKTAGAKEIDWAAINPNIADATYVKDTAKCLECHEDYMQTFDKTRHAMAFKLGAQNELQSRGCEACHGPLSKHLTASRKKEFYISLKSDSPITPQQRNSICLQCHEKGQIMEWRSGLHRASGVSCDSCHYITERKSDRALFINEDVKTACYKCHPDKKAQSLKASHMPVREGKLDCSNCHNPHGSSNPKMLKAGSVNDLCYSCHAEKRGPFLWEHAPVRENCTNCHEPHGSNNPGLLNAKGPFLCMQCHQYGGHLNRPRYVEVNALNGKGCINCHNRIHGSNHPSGAKFTR